MVSHGKRQCPSGEESHATIDDFEKLLDDTQARLSNEFNTTLRKFHKMQTDRIDLIQNKVETISAKVDLHDSEISALRQEMLQLRERIGLAESPNHVAPPLPDSWERAARAEVLSIGAGDHIPKSLLEDTVKEWLEPLAIKREDWRLNGPPHGRRFDLVFNGLSEIGAARANKANLLLRNADGTWRQLQSKDCEDKPVDLFISKDQMPKERREETLGKRFF